MQYMLMCCFEESKWLKLPDSERGRIMNEYGKLIDELREHGVLLSGAKLDVVSSAVTVQSKSGVPVVTDGPFAECKEQLGGYHIVECKNQDEAVAIAQKIPTLPAGGIVEVRPLLHAE